MINIIIALIIGGVIGWLASIVMRTDAQQGIFLNVIVGIVGSLLGSFLASALGLVRGTLFDAPFSPMVLLVALVGAIILLAIVNLARRGRVR